MGSKKQALTEIENRLQTIAESQTKRTKLPLEADEKRKEKERQFRKEESQRNRRHELQIAEIYARAFSSTI